MSEHTHQGDPCTVCGARIEWQSLSEAAQTPVLQRQLKDAILALTMIAYDQHPLVKSRSIAREFLEEVRTP